MLRLESANITDAQAVLAEHENQIGSGGPLDPASLPRERPNLGVILALRVGQIGDTGDGPG